MTAAQLIERLKTFPPQAVVVMPDEFGDLPVRPVQSAEMDQTFATSAKKKRGHMLMVVLK